MRFLNISETSLYPVAFDNQSTLDVSGANGGAGVSLEGIKEFEDYDHDLDVTAYIVPRDTGDVIMYNMRLPQFSNQSDTQTAVGTAATWLISDILAQRETCETCDRLSSLPTRNVKALVAWVPQPFVVASGRDLPAPGDEDIYSIVNKTKKLLINPRSLYEQLLILTKQAPIIGDQIPILWSPAAEDPHTLVSMNLRVEPTEGRDWNACTICTVSAFWRTARVTLEKKSELYRTRPEMPYDFRNVLKKDLTPIALSPNLSHYSNYSLPYLKTLQGLQNYLPQYVTFALAGVPGRAWLDARNSSPDGSYKPLGGVPSTELQDISEATPYRIETVKEGFGYGTRDRSAQLSVAVITAYCLVTLIYIGYIVITGHVSIAWTSPTELIMLALQSKEPSDIGHVSVGIDSMENLRRNVGIRVSTVGIGDTGEMRERLELVFEDDEDTERRDLTKVVRGTAY
ncbi:hypothetical protein E8E13_003670 [Curvularia kusanoi]|uniref:Uncharacterized protein n=1 Tax=Curvularia kusanoi TaxID=90978 RepID=A0A9P4W7L8_CURKU|nr:hypothetical protein E8E13_003670 [Curvularia kusanoi]